MIKPFSTSHTIEHSNVIFGLLTQAKAPVGISGKTVNARHYLLGICDWCGAREIIDDPVVADTQIGVVEEQRHKSFRDGLNWVISYIPNSRHFCCNRCSHTYYESKKV